MNFSAISIVAGISQPRAFEYCESCVIQILKCSEHDHVDNLRMHWISLDDLKIWVLMSLWGKWEIVELLGGVSQSPQLSCLVMLGGRVETPWHHWPKTVDKSKNSCFLLVCPCDCWNLRNLTDLNFLIVHSPVVSGNLSSLENLVK